MTENKKVNKKEDIDVIVFTSKYSPLAILSKSSFKIFGEYNYIFIHEFYQLFNRIDEIINANKFVTVIIDCDNLVTLTDINIIKGFFNVNIPNYLIKEPYNEINDNHTVWAYILFALKQHYKDRILLLLNSYAKKDSLANTITGVFNELSNDIDFIQEPSFIKEYNICVKNLIRNRNKTKQIIYKSNIAKYSVLFKINKNNKVKYG